jgi:AcrR family transcriptional regulator
MTPRRAPRGAGSDKPRTGKGATQRQRLLTGMVEVAAGRGYAGASISSVIAQAGVSRPTFYEYFAGREECFSSATELVQSALRDSVSQALANSDPDHALAGAIAAIVRFAAEDPTRARFLVSETMAGGTQTLALRDRGIAELASLIDDAVRSVPPATPLPDLDYRILLGGVYRLLAIRLRRREPSLSRLTTDLEPWIDSYARALRDHRWRTLSPATPLPPSPHVPSEPIQRMPGALPPGRPRVSEEVAENHRLRILYAAARMAEKKGYLATTVADITKLAGLSGPQFYRLFADKQEAFLAVHELGFQQVMDITSKAYFSGSTWPERSWEAGRALTQLLEDNPLVAHVGFVEAYAVGPAAVQRIDDSHVAFMFFLQEGLLHRPQEPPPSRVAMEAIIASIFEIIYLAARSRGKPQVSAMLPQIAHISLTPFLGPAGSDTFIDAQIAKAAKDRKSGR